MPTGRVEQLIALIGLVAIGVLGVLTVLSWDRYRDRTAGTTAAATPTRAEAAEVTTAPVAAAAPSPPTTTQATATRASTAPRTARLVIAALKGDCWVEVRAGSAGGRLLHAGVLPRGRSLRFARKRLWVRLGAAPNVRLALNGKPVRVSLVTGTLLVTPARVRTLATA